MKSQEKIILIIAHLAMFLARTGFGLIIPLIIYLNSEGLGKRLVRKSSLNILKFQAKLTFTFLGLQFLGLIYQIVINFVQAPFLAKLAFSPYNPLAIIGLASQIILIAGIILALIGASVTAKGNQFRYPSLWISRGK